MVWWMWLVKVLFGLVLIFLAFHTVSVGSVALTKYGKAKIGAGFFAIAIFCAFLFYWLIFPGI